MYKYIYYSIDIKSNKLIFIYFCITLNTNIMATNYQNTVPYIITSVIGTVPQLSSAVTGNITTVKNGFTLSTPQTTIVQTGGYIYNSATKELRKITSIKNNPSGSAVLTDANAQQVIGGTIEFPFSAELVASAFKYITAGSAQMKEVILTAANQAGKIIDNAGISRAVLLANIPTPISKNGNGRSGTNATITPFLVDATGTNVSVIISY